MLHAVDILLLAILLYIERQLHYRFLRFGAVAVGLGAMAALAGQFELGPLPMVLGFAASSFLLGAVADLKGLAYPWRAWLVLAVLAAGLVLAGTLAGWPEGYGESIEVAATSLLMFWAAGWLATLERRTVGSLGLAAVLVAGAVLASLPVAVVGERVSERLDVVAEAMNLLAALALLLIAYERSMAEIAERDLRLREFAEERRRLELQFSHAQKLESLGVLAGGIAHDFNNMLTSILGYASLALKKLPIESEVRKDIYMVMSGARQAVDLTSQMLIYAGKGALEFESVDISRVVENMSSLVHSIVPRKIQLVQKLARDLPVLKGDRVQLGQVVMNLVANGVDAVGDEPGVIEISTGLAEVDRATLGASLFADEQEPGAFLFLRVRDTGVGMNEAQVERIFDPFYTEKEKGKGLGLSSLSGIVRQHKGFIRVQSRPGEGSEFTVYFPIVIVTDNHGPARYAGQPAGRRGNILLADDDPRIRSLMMSILESDDFQLSAAEDGKEALALFEAAGGAYDLLVLDCTMPKMSGGELYRRIRSEGSKVPVVLVSGYHQEQVARNIASDPLAWFIKKPFSVDEFLSEVHTALRARQSA